MLFNFGGLKGDHTFRELPTDLNRTPKIREEVAPLQVRISPFGHTSSALRGVFLPVSSA